jgi:hypothetical protein
MNDTLHGSEHEPNESYGTYRTSNIVALHPIETIGVGVAAYHQDAHLARTLEAADEALREAGIDPVARVVAIGDGSIAAERIAIEHGWTARRTMTGSPKTRAAAREAARRAAGGDATLLIDGDTAMATGWLRDAIARLNEHGGIAGIGGAVDEAHWRGGAMVGGARDVDGVSAGTTVTRLRDVALWRRTPVDEAGGFDVWLPGDDDAELVQRLRLGGRGVETLPTRAGVRHGTARWSFGDWWSATRRGELAGLGLALRRVHGTLGFKPMLRRSTASIAAFLWGVVGAVLAIATLGGGPFVVWTWTTVALVAFFAVLRWNLRRSFFGALTLFTQGLFVARQLLVPVGRSRLGAAPRPIVPRRDPKGAASQGSEPMEEPHPFQRVAGMPRDPDEPPAVVDRY